MSSLYNWFWYNGISYILYFILLVSSLWTSITIMMSSLQNKYAEWNYRYRIRKVRSMTLISNQNEYKSPLMRHLYLLIRTTKEERNDWDVPIFMFFSGLVGVISSLFIGFIINDLVIAIVLGALLALIPYLFLRLKLSNIRYLMGQEFLSIVQKLTQNYNSANFDMYYALTETQKEIQNHQLRKVIIKLVSDLQVSRNESELRDSIQIFTYTAGSNWSKRLGSIILKSYLHGENVINALMTLTKQIEDTEEMLEEAKSETLDVVYNGYFTIPAFIGFLLLGYYSSGAQDWFQLQFRNSVTLFLFILSSVGVIFSIIISVFLKQPKNDL